MQDTQVEKTNVLQGLHCVLGIDQILCPDGKAPTYAIVDTDI